ncbi:MAG TPA: DUF1385 domain-containing protein [Halanaerobiaceae bacterium]|jgi:uncharacterized protein YqhQ|nr:DUF1385 domain-containing protein [Bacillota bacterium]HHU92093.1 DUF1385 domain-containing protein [Halanaerobiaceae bacterium]HOA40157.1 DUF1385 domain-containing protein [Halanaerobiales bacterium]HPZ62439.1 DUF1385 domain-containing protein [Halanaerobiales bacterium]HQD03679.1 DUF1385 domain-containing protein [Halanaerobiales bacterium]
MSKKQYGGQALIEGVMMRGEDSIAIAVRRAPGDIILKKEKIRSVADKYPFLKWPFIRGVVALISSLVIGIQALTFSASQFAEEEEEELSPLEMTGAILMAFGAAVVLFIVLPASLISLLQKFITSNIILNLIEGIIKIITFLVYLLLIARMEDIKRVFMYHGAEHKTIFTYEAGLPLTVENARQFGTLHPRCGTNFMFIVILISIFFFSFLGRPPLLQRILYHLLLLPVIAGTSYEVLKLGAKDKVNPVIKLLATPGLYLQKITTKEPDDAMLEVAIAALKAVLPEGEVGENAGL